MLLDPAIRDWVLLPLLALVIIVTFARMHAMRLIQPTPEAPDADGVRQRSVVARSARLRANGGYIGFSGWSMRRDWLIGTGSGKLLDEKVKDRNPMAMGPMAQMDMMKVQMVNMASQIGIGMLVGAFFTGFVALKLPFTLTERFKALTQQGVGVPGLDTSFVSTSSWFFTAQFGLNNLFRLFSRSAGAAVDEARMMQMQMGMGMPGMGGPGAGQQFMAKTAYNNEKQAMELLQWAPTPLLQAERALLEQAAALGLAPRPASLPGGGVPLLAGPGARGAAPAVTMLGGTQLGGRAKAE